MMRNAIHLGINVLTLFFYCNLPMSFHCASG